MNITRKANNFVYILILIMLNINIVNNDKS